MSETPKDVAAERDALRAENEQLRGQLAAAGANRPAAAQHTFQLSQGGLAELEAFGHTTVDGETLTTEQVRARLAGDQKDLKIKEASAPVTLPAGRNRTKIEGVDFIRVPSEPGLNVPPARATDAK